jgi:hypothetical protein
VGSARGCEALPKALEMQRRGRPRLYNGVTIMLAWCWDGVQMVLRCAGMVLEWCSNGVQMVLGWCPHLSCSGRSRPEFLGKQQAHLARGEEVPAGARTHAVVL